MSDYQLIVIGGGPGGYSAALRAAKLGLHTALIERREVGGTCLNRGCIPTKTLLHASQLVHELSQGAAFGVRAEGVSVDLEALFRRKEEVSAKLRGGIEGLLKSHKVALLRGEGQVVGSHQVRLTDSEGTKQLFTADRILLATGTVPARPPIPGLTLPGVLTSDELLAGGHPLWDSLTIIGGGVIGVEFATFYRDLGCRVTIVEGLDRLLPSMERELGQSLALLLKKQGVAIHTGALVEGVEKNPDGLCVRFTQKGESLTVQSRAVLCAIGRKPYWDGLFGEGLVPTAERGRLVVDDRYQTSVPDVYAIGDVSSPVQLAHVAAAQGIACATYLAGQDAAAVTAAVPGCIYCRPEIAAVGLTADEAKATGQAVKVGKYVMFSNGKTVLCQGERGFIKIVADAQTRIIVGAQLMCEHATDMVGELAAAIVNGLTVEQMLAVMRPHPTFEEGVTEALEDLAAKL